jgi:hypothetical protein
MSPKIIIEKGVLKTSDASQVQLEGRDVEALRTLLETFDGSLELEIGGCVTFTGGVEVSLEELRAINVLLAESK